MKGAGLIRLGGLAALVSGAAYAVLGLVIWLRAPDVPEGIVFIIDVLFFLLVLGAMAAIAAVHTLQREHYGWPGTLASLIAFVGVVLILVGELRGVLARLQPDSGAELLAGVPWLFFIGLLVATVGITALGIVTIDAGVLPWWCGAALIAGSPFFGLLFYLFSPAEDSLVGVPWALVGYAVFRAGTRLPERSSRVR
jgi:hypothetical protein